MLAQSLRIDGVVPYTHMVQIARMVQVVRTLQRYTCTTLQILTSLLEKIDWEAVSYTSSICSKQLYVTISLARSVFRPHWGMHLSTP